MPLYTAEALILRTYKLADADRIVVFLSRDRGKKRGVARGARRPRSAFMGALEPLTRVRVAYYEREHRDLVRLDYADPLRSPLSARLPEALGYVGYFAELIDEWAPENDPSEPLYRLGASVVEAFADAVPVDRLARYFEYWLLRLQGLYPSLFACHRCGEGLAAGARLPVHGHVFVCRRCKPDGHAAELSAEAIEFLRCAAALPPARLPGVAWSPRAGRELEVAHQLLIRTHLEKELRSSRVLRELRQ